MSNAAVGWAVAVAALVWTVSERVVRLEPLLVTLVCSVTAALALEAPVSWLAARRLHRRASALLLLVTAALLLAVFFAAGASLLVTQSREVAGRVEELSLSVSELAVNWFGVSVSPEDVEGFLRSKDGPVAWLLQAVSQLSWPVTATFGYVLTGAFFTFYLLVDGPLLRSAIAGRLPEPAAAALGSAFVTAVAKAGGWLRLRIVLAVVCGLFCWVVLAVLQVPSAAFLALWCALVSQLVPVLGAYLAAALPSVVALLVSPATAVVFLAAFVAYQQVENLLVAPYLARWALRLHPAVGLFAVIAAALMWGPAIALVASPVTATVLAFASSYVPETRKR